MILYNSLTKVWRFFSRINDKIFRKGGDFSDWMNQSELGFSDKCGNKYQPSSGKIIYALKQLNISNEDCILDIGCGKGRAMYMMSGFPFKIIDGFDLSDKMVEIANLNFNKVGISNRCKAFKADAANFKDFSQYDFFYAFNPVPKDVFKKLLVNIVNDIKKNPRKCIFIYMNPEYDDYLQKETPFILFKTIKSMIKWNDIYVYMYDGMRG